MKKRLLIITFIFALILTVFAQVAVFAEGDDHGADAHSDSMVVEEVEDDYDDLTFREMIIEAVKANIKYVALAVGGLIVLVILIKVIGTINRKKEPKYRGKH